MTQNKLPYFMLYILASILVISITMTYIIIQKDENGAGMITTNYYDIMFTNTTIDFDSKIQVNIDDEKDKISINIPNINEYKNKNSFSVDVINIGNIDAYVENMYLNNISTDIETSNINLDISFVKDDVIKGSESKKIIISIEYTGEELKEETGFSFDINYKFTEVVL